MSVFGEKGDAMRGRIAWYMSIEDIQLGHILGFDYPIRGDERPQK